MRIGTTECRREIIAWISRQLSDLGASTVNAALIKADNWKRQDKRNGEGGQVIRIFANGNYTVRIIENSGKVSLTWLDAPPGFFAGYGEAPMKAEDRVPKPEAWGDFA